MRAARGILEGSSMPQSPTLQEYSDGDGRRVKRKSGALDICGVPTP